MQHFIDRSQDDYANVAMDDKANIAAQIVKNQWYCDEQLVRMKPITQ